MRQGNFGQKGKWVSRTGLFAIGRQTFVFKVIPIQANDSSWIGIDQEINNWHQDKSEKSMV